MSSAARDLETCQKLCKELKDQIKKLRGQTESKILAKIAQNVECEPYEPKNRNTCTGHFGKIYALHWGPDSQAIVTASQDGKLIIWSSTTGNKQLAITLNSAWVMTCAFSPTYEFIASGGLDNTVSIFKTSNQNNVQGPNGARFRSKDLYRELEKHDGYLSCARFVDDTEIISASGDSTCILWDVENRSAKNIFTDHAGDVMFVDLNPADPSQFVSGSVDKTAKVWDVRSDPPLVANFPGSDDKDDKSRGHYSDINTVKWFTDSQSIMTGSDDGTVRLFDIRSYRQINEYKDTENRSLHSQEAAGVTSVDVSASGWYCFAAYDNGQVYMWSTLKAEKICDMPHDSRVSSLGVSPDGYALATGCWDFNLRVFA